MNRGEKARVNKELKVYERRRFGGRGEKTIEEAGEVVEEDIQSQSDVPSAPSTPVPSLSPEISPMSSSQETRGNNSTPLEHVDLPLALQRGRRICRSPVRYGFEKHDLANFMSYSHISPAYRVFIASLQTMSIPSDWRCAKQDLRWKRAMMEKLHALQKNQTWELVPLPVGKRAVGCKWVFTMKQTPEGKVDRYKARLVAKCYSQTYGIDYDETFAPVAKMGTVRMLISYAANFGWPLHQLDVKNAFLHGNLEEEVYMEVPPGFSNKQTIGKVCKLKKSLYGLKQSPKAWFDRFRRAICDMGYSQCSGDHTVFYKHKGPYITILAVYVDDI